MLLDLTDLVVPGAGPAVLGATVEHCSSDIRYLQNPRAQVEAFLTLNFELEQRDERNDKVSRER
ncbi:hypothetical protein PHMEG_00020823 [Phytophthora megakarya]|uniref:Uncharacterized protein n=1 Tax=Phytophthora megakarya TaxID=4795 RepID=A0A225VPB9_9STRA|nr:hypothetical protein PHMEG_00020823 [Phytophthora megakarya]